MLQLFNTLMLCGTVLLALFLILLAMPKSMLRNVVLEVGGWSSACLGTIYVISPIDLIPDFIPILGQIDDLGALAGSIVAVITALSARKDRQQLEKEASRQQAEEATDDPRLLEQTRED